MKKLRRNWLPVTAVFVGASIITILLAMYLFNSSILKGSIAAIYSFKDSKTQSREETYNDFYLKGYEIGEENNHVSNVCNITIEDIKEKGYCYGYAATNSNEAGENKNGKKKKVVQIEADTVIVNESKNNISITDFKENTVVPHDKEGEGSEEKKDS